MSLLVQIITPFCLIKLSSYHWIVSCIYYCLLLHQYKTLKLNKFNLIKLCFRTCENKNETYNFCVNDPRKDLKFCDRNQLEK